MAKRKELTITPAHLNELKILYYDVYGDNPFHPVDLSFETLLEIMKNSYVNRHATLLKADSDNPDWYHGSHVVGTTLYIDLFSQDIKTFESHIPYFVELGITFIHFMPILTGRPGENDGGYAVMDYRHIDPKYGETTEFLKLLKKLRQQGIHSCIDFVINHTAKEHPFALKAMEGNQKYMDMYFMYDDRNIPDQFEATVPEVFPGVSPGNFTYYDRIKKWVFTSFYEFQWDLNFKNPFVFEQMTDILLNMANMGVDMIRLDAIPFMWKEIGTTCRNHPMIHKLLRMFKLITKIVCPSVALLGEAIVEPEEILGYFGRQQSECDLMYNATHMVNLWNSLATRDTTLLKIDAERLKSPANGCWINYARCHDDIGWGFNEAAVRHMGQDPFAHKQFLIHFYEGSFPGSFSIGELYEYDEETQDARNCGTMASLCGLEKAKHNKDQYQIELAIKRINLINSILLASEGLPLIYSGDEIAQLNDKGYRDHIEHAHDSRWLHRMPFNHEQAEYRNQRGHYEYQVFQPLKRMIQIKKEHALFAPTVAQHILWPDNPHVYCFYKEHEGKKLLALFNFSEDRQFVPTHKMHVQGIHGLKADLLTGKKVNINQDSILLGPYESLWLL